MTLTLSKRAEQTGDQPISYFLKQGLDNPQLISLAAGLVDAESLPAAEVRQTMDEILADPATARVALQYGTTEGYAPLRDKVARMILALDGFKTGETPWSAENVVMTTGSQQLLYLVGELLLDPGDIVITEAPSYFVFHGALASMRARTLSVPMDDEGMQTDALAELLARLEQTGELDRVKLIYTVDYFQNPTGLTLSLRRRHQLLELARRYSKRQRIFILEDAAYRELRFDGDDIPSILGLDRDSQVILGMTFSKPWAPGLKTGYGILPRELVAPLLRFKGNHDFGSSNLNQVVLDRLLARGDYARHVEQLRQVYRRKRDAMLDALDREFAANSDLSWTRPQGGLYVWLRGPRELQMGPASPLMQAALREGVLYVPGEFCYVQDDAALCRSEARLSFGVATPEMIGEAIRRLGAAARSVAPEKIVMRAFAGCRG